MTVKKFARFLIRTFENYVEIKNFSNNDLSDVDMFEVWDYLEENFKLPVPVLTTHAKCYSVSPEAQLQLGDIAKKYYSAIAVVNENSIDTDAVENSNDVFLQDVPVRMFNSKSEAIQWLSSFKPVETL